MISKKINFIIIGILLSFVATECQSAAKAPPPPVRPRCPSLEDLFKMANPEGALHTLKAEKPHCVPKLCREIQAGNFFQRAQDAKVPTLMSRKMGFFCANVDPEWARLQEVQQGAKLDKGGPAFPKLRPLSPKTTRAPSPKPSLPTLRPISPPPVQLTPLEAERIEVGRAQVVDLPEGPTIQKVDSRYHTAQVPMMRATLDIHHPPRDFEAERRELERQRQAAEEEAKRQGRLHELQGQFAVLKDHLKRAQENYDSLTVAVMILKEDLIRLEHDRTSRRVVLDGFSATASQNKDPQTYMNELENALKNRHNREKFRGKDDLPQIETAAHLLREAERNLQAGRLDLERINREMLQSGVLGESTL